MTKRPLPTLLTFTALALLAACSRGGDTPPAPTEPAAAPQETSPPAYTRTPSNASAAVRFVTPADGDTVTSPFTVTFAASGMQVVKAGDDTPDSGHHHILVDTGMPDMNLPIPADENHIHFGDGSSSTELTLAPGEHTLQLLFADHLHIPHEPPVYSEVITITVE